MVRLHAGFSAAAAAGAMLAGAVGPDAYWVVAGLYVVLTAATSARTCLLSPLCHAKSRRR